MRYGTGVTYKVFVRTWWRRDAIGQRVPGPGPSRTIARRCTADEARRIAQEWNATHDPGPLSRKAEWGEE